MSLWKRGERVAEPAPAVTANEIEALRQRVGDQVLRGDREGRSACLLEVDSMLRAIGNAIPDTRDLLLDLRLLLGPVIRSRA